MMYLDHCQRASPHSFSLNRHCATTAFGLWKLGAVSQTQQNEMMKHHLTEHHPGALTFGHRSFHQA
jgi:hypothetical protein